jgi:hypothetical protein
LKKIKRKKLAKSIEFCQFSHTEKLVKIHTNQTLANGSWTLVDDPHCWQDTRKFLKYSSCLYRVSSSISFLLKSSCKWLIFKSRSLNSNLSSLLDRVISRMSVFFLKLLFPEMFELSEIFDTFSLLSLMGVRTIELIGTSLGISLLYD